MILLTQLKMIPAGDILPAWKQGDFLVIPDMAGFLGADTVAGVLETGMLDRKETTRLMQEILAGLGEDQRMVIGMFYYEEMSIRQIAETLGCSENTVKSRLNYGRKKI